MIEPNRLLPYRSIYAILLSAYLTAPIEVGAQAFECADNNNVARLESVNGTVTVDDRLATAGQLLCPGQLIETGEAARAAVRLTSNDTIIRLRADSNLRMPAQEEDGVLSLVKGWLYVFSKTRRTLDIETPFVTAGIDGTEFAIAALSDGSDVYLFEGSVTARDDGGSVIESIETGARLSVAADGRTAIEALGEVDAPYRPLRLAGRDVVNWALFYPSVLTDGTGPVTEAADLLALGAIDAAQELLTGLAESADKASLEAVIATAQEDLDLALARADAAIALAPHAAAPRLARSYALQSRFRLEEAREEVRIASESDPDNAVVWARLAELELMLGDRRASRTAAERAASLADTPQTAIVEGFTALAERRRDAATERFLHALNLESEQPLAWLGQGLAQILGGELEDGRASLETAVLHDPNNALIRAYLGKAYFEERRSGDAEVQLAIAQELDPADPTAFFYDAILKQLDNRPVEALFALDEAISRNDNRGVYRSRLLLDQDSAARNASLAQIYDDLGFEAPAIGLAAKSIAESPSNPSAHRLLSDIYGRRLRYEVASTSELLRYQLLRPLSLSTIRPSASFVDLNRAAIDGPSQAGFSEFNALFERNRAQITASGVAGQNGTLGNEIVAGVLHDNVSASVGQFHFESDGYRPNNDVDHDVLEAMAQVQVTPEFSLLAGIRHRDTNQGDIEERFDPDDFNPNERRDITETIPRVGFRWSAVPSSTLIGTLAYNERDESVEDNDVLEVELSREDRAFAGELQHILERGIYTLTLGGGAYDAERKTDNFAFFPGVFPPFPGAPPIVPPMILEDRETKTEVHQHNIYAYASAPIDDFAILEAGLSFDNYFERDGVDEERFGPKLGITLEPTDNVTVRAAALRTLKRNLTLDQTIEPTTVAGFNQIFDYTNGSRTDLLGLGVDWVLNQRLSAGIESTYVEVDEPQNDDENLETFKFDEQAISGYLSAVPNDQLALSLSPRYSHLETDPAFDLDTDTPDELDTVSVPTRLSYFSPTGFFAHFSAEYIYQEVSRSSGTTKAVGSDSEIFLGAGVGYRLPNRRGILSFEIKNLLDRQMQYQDLNFINARVADSGIEQDRLMLVRGTLQF